MAVPPSPFRLHRTYTYTLVYAYNNTYKTPHYQSANLHPTEHIRDGDRLGERNGLVESEWLEDRVGISPE